MPKRTIPARRTASLHRNALQRYGLGATATQRAIALQNQGYEIKVLPEQEAQACQAGVTDNEWLLIGILAGVIVIAVAVID